MSANLPNLVAGDFPVAEHPGPAAVHGHAVTGGNGCVWTGNLVLNEAMLCSIIHYVKVVAQFRPLLIKTYRL